MDYIVFIEAPEAQLLFNDLLKNFSENAKSRGITILPSSKATKKVAKTLHDELNAAGNEYFNSERKRENEVKFAASCAMALFKATPLLSQNKDWREVFSSTIKQVADLIKSENLKYLSDSVSSSQVGKAKGVINTFKDKITQLKSVYFKQLPQKAEELFIRDFNAVFESSKEGAIKSNLDAIVSKREVVKIGEKSLTLTEMEERGYFNEDGRIRDEFRDLFDDRCLDPANYPNAKSDKERVVLSSLVYAINTKVIESMKNDLNELMQEVSLSKDPSFIQQQMQINGNIANLEASSETLKKFINEFNLTEKLDKLDKVDFSTSLIAP